MHDERRSGTHNLERQDVDESAKALLPHYSKPTTKTAIISRVSRSTIPSKRNKRTDTQQIYKSMCTYIYIYIYIYTHTLQDLRNLKRCHTSESEESRRSNQDRSAWPLRQRPTLRDSCMAYAPRWL
uniref:Uncharacterized protein n=1 Tax=Physcomitrium patens TaxID=3218 RepID=A0A2K1IR90_PHYPA|nr:hypothetical protein PHYPA_025914 [Physcomitrium patens]